MQEANVLRNHVKDAVLATLDETFVKVQGYYLDKGTSLLETLATLTATEVSVPVSDSGASIAGHVEHVRFYLEVLTKTLRGHEVGKVDWEQSWLVHTVTTEEWDALRTALREAYQEVRGLLEGFDTWEGEEDVDGALAVIIHTAYHLGAIRLALYGVRSGLFQAVPFL
jgi:hypothetical protein